jgi:hypothetical protein
MQLITPSATPTLADLADTIRAIAIIRVPLGAVDSIEDLKTLVPAVAEALRTGDEASLQSVERFLCPINELVL